MPSLHPCWASVEVLLTFILLLPKVFSFCGKGQQEGACAFVSATTVHCPAHFLTDKNKTLTRNRAAEVQRRALVSFSHNVGGNLLQRNQILALSVMKKFSEAQKGMLINTTMPASSTRTPKTGHQDRLPSGAVAQSYQFPKGHKLSCSVLMASLDAFTWSKCKAVRNTLCQKKKWAISLAAECHGKSTFKDSWRRVYL